MHLQGRVAAVTGAARGIGLAIVEMLVEEGAKVALLDVDLEEARRQVERLTTAGAEVLALKMDVSNPEEVKGAVQKIVDFFGRIDILVNNAGIPGPSVPLWEVSDEDWRRTLAVNLDGVFHCCRAVIPYMLEQGYGRIVNIASIAGKEGNPNLAPYSTAKAGVIGLTKALGKELATRGILVNCVTPAVIETEILKGVKPEVVEDLVSKIPMGRMGRPSEVAALVVWLASEACSFSTGAVFDISGGRATY